MVVSVVQTVYFFDSVSLGERTGSRASDGHSEDETRGGRVKVDLGPRRPYGIPPPSTIETVESDSGRTTCPRSVLGTLSPVGSSGTLASSSGSEGRTRKSRSRFLTRLDPSVCNGLLSRKGTHSRVHTGPGVDPGRTKVLSVSDRVPSFLTPDPPSLRTDSGSRQCFSDARVRTVNWRDPEVKE